MEKIKIKFDKPINFDGKETEVIEVRKPKMKDIRLAAETYNPQENPLAYEMQLIANLMEVTLDDVDELEPAVYQKIKKELEPFLS